MTGKKGASEHDSLLCGSRRNKFPDKNCKRPAGWGTDHVGEGRCKLHGGATPIKHGRYSKIGRARLREKLEIVEQDPDPLNLTADIQLARAILHEASDLNIENMGPKFGTFLTELLERVSRIAKRHHEMQEQRGVSLETLRWIKEQMGLVVAEHVTDADTLRAIESGWNSIVVKS